MIRFDLICENDHEFDSWFADAGAYDEQNRAGLVSCPFCNSQNIEKRLMAPAIPAKANKSDEDCQTMLSANDDLVIKEMTENIRKLRQHVTENAENVGKDFAKEAREIHYQEKPARGIYGQASVDEAKSLLEEGVDVMPLPTLPEEKN